MLSEQFPAFFQRIAEKLCREARDKNPPLTLEELREMDGEPLGLGKFYHAVNGYTFKLLDFCQRFSHDRKFDLRHLLRLQPGVLIGSEAFPCGLFPCTPITYAGGASGDGRGAGVDYPNAWKRRFLHLDAG